MKDGVRDDRGSALVLPELGEKTCRGCGSYISVMGNAQRNNIHYYYLSELWVAVAWGSLRIRYLLVCSRRQTQRQLCIWACSATPHPPSPLNYGWTCVYSQ